MIQYAVKKVVSLGITLWLVVTLTFFLMQQIPGDPFDAEGRLPDAILQQLRSYYELDAPILVQYVKYLKQSFTFDFGPSMVYEYLTVNEIIKDSFPISLWLGLEALFLALGIGISAGVLSVWTSKKWIYHLLMLFTTLALAIPSYLMAAALQYVFAYKLNWVSIARWGTISQSILPALSLAALPSAFIFRLVRNSLLDVLKQDYIKTALAKGLSWPYIFRCHCLRNAIGPVISYIGQISASILTGSFVVEKIYGIPGLGQWLLLSVSNRDYPVIMGLTIFYSLILLSAVALIDILYAWLDPRITFERRASLA